MKRLLFFIGMLAILVALAIPAAAKTPKETETVVFTVQPKMSCRNCETKIKSNLRFEKGVSKIVTSVPKQTVTISYDPAKTDIEHLTAAFAKIGYKATQASVEAD